MSINESEAIKMFNNPKKGLWGKTKMLKKYKEMLNKVYSLQRHREVTSKNQKKLYKREGAIRPFFSVQIDLADFPKLQNPLNKNIRYLMICVDVFSRFIFIKPIRTKENLHIPLKEMLNDMKAKYGKTPANMTGDNEFDTNELKNLAGDFKFRWWFGDPHEKFRTGIVERAIRTVRNLIKRYLTQNDTTKYIDVLQDLIENYNDTEHTHIRTKPRIALKSGQTFPKPMKKDIPVLGAGDMVRVMLERKRAFDKGDKPYYSKELYEVVKKVGNKYQVRDMDSGVIPTKTYYIHQLLHVKGVIKDKYENAPNDVAGYDRGIEHKTKQRRNKRALKGIDINNIIDEDEREEARRALHYNDDEFYHDKPLPKKISNKKLKNKQKNLEKRVVIDIESSDESEQEDYDQQIKDLQKQISASRNRRRVVVRLRRKIEKLKGLKAIANKKNKKKKAKAPPVRRGKRVRKKPKRYGY